MGWSAYVQCLKYVLAKVSVLNKPVELGGYVLRIDDLFLLVQLASKETDLLEQLLKQGVLKSAWYCLIREFFG